MKNYKYIFFDLDGTLLDTLNDIVYAINKTMEQFSYDLRFDYESGKYLIGSGAKILVQRALSSLNLNEEQINQFYEAYLPNYLKYQGMSTYPFETVIDTLKTLNDSGIKLFITTNKPQKMSDDIISRLNMNQYFIENIGQSERLIRKPDPDVLNYLIKKYNINKEEILYVGDSSVDYEFAKTINLDMAFCDYGYETNKQQLIQKADYVLYKFSDLLDIVNH